MKIIEFSILILLISSTIQLLINKQDDFLSGQSDDNEAKRTEASMIKSENISETAVKSIDITGNNQNSEIKADEKRNFEDIKPANMIASPNKAQENISSQRKPANTSSEKVPLVDLKTVNLDFVNTVAKRVTQNNPLEKENNKLNFNILIGNNNVKVENKSIRQ